MHNKTKTSAISLASILFLAVLIVPSVYADESIVDVVTINVPVSCSMSATGTDSHTATVNNGQTTENIGTTNLKVICNDNSGYAIYAIGYTDDTYGKTVLTSSTLGSTHDIATATTVSTGTSSWAMKLASVSGTYAPIIAGSTGDSLKQTGDPDFSDYTAVPEEYTKVAYHTASTDTGTNATGSNLTTTYRAYISPSQPAGTYVGQVKYTLVHPNMNDNSNKPVAPLTANDCEAGYVCYAPNANDVIGSMSSLGSITSSPRAGKISVGTSATEITLIAPNYSRPGYGFAGWSTEWDAVSVYNNNETVFVYGPNETITASDLSTNEGITFSSRGLILYPVWIASAGNLQGANGQGWTGCSSLTTAPTNTRATLTSMTALTDTRDNNVYAVAKLADGKCWMVENLRLNAENSRGDANIAKAQGYGDATDSIQGDLGIFVGLADSEDSNFAAFIVANSLYSVDGSNNTISINDNSSYYPAYRMPRYNNNNTNMVTGATNSDDNTTLTDSYNGTGNNLRWFSYGNNYNWPAAMADTGYYTGYYNANNNEHQNSDAAGTSICPKGWKLPLGATSTGNIDQGEGLSSNRVGGFSYLDRKLGGTGADQYGAQPKKWCSFPNNFLRSGGWLNGGSTTSRSGRAIYWSSSASSATAAYTFNPSLAGGNPGGYRFDKTNAASVRCILGS